MPRVSTGAPPPPPPAPLPVVLDPAPPPAPPLPVVLALPVVVVLVPPVVVVLPVVALLVLALPPVPVLLAPGSLEQAASARTARQGARRGRMEDLGGVEREERAARRAGACPPRASSTLSRGGIPSLAARDRL
jgi:hypothetical protein